MHCVIRACGSQTFWFSAHSASISRFQRAGSFSSCFFMRLSICCFNGPFGSRACCHVTCVFW